MGRFLILLSLLFSLSAGAATPSIAPTMQLCGSTVGSALNPSGGVTIPSTDTSWYTVIAYIDGGISTAGNYYALWKNGSKWQAGANGAHCVCWSASATTAGLGMQMASNTASVDNVANGGLTTPTYQFGRTAGYGIQSSLTANEYRTELQTFDLPANGWGLLQVDTSSQGFRFRAVCKDK